MDYSTLLNYSGSRHEQNTLINDAHGLIKWTIMELISARPLQRIPPLGPNYTLIKYTYVEGVDPHHPMKQVTLSFLLSHLSPLCTLE